MKLTESYFFPTITNDGALELYAFCKAILLKQAAAIPKGQHEDLLQEMILRCLEKLPYFDSTKGIPLGGYLYWQCRGAISIWANHNGKELPMEEGKLLQIKRAKELRDEDF